MLGAKLEIDIALLLRHGKKTLGPLTQIVRFDNPYCGTSAMMMGIT